MIDTANTPYVSVFSTDRPRDGIDLMQQRLRSALKLNDELADYFKERAMIEDLYAKHLMKLSKKIFVTDKSALGTMLPTWERIHKELEDTSIIHSTFSHQMVDTIEKSLRSTIVNDSVYAELRSMDPTFQKLAKDYDDRHGKWLKHKKTIEKPGKKPVDAESKCLEAKKQFDSTKGEWQQYSSKYIQLFQTVDEHRWHAMKAHLLQFETLQTDQMLKRVQLAGDNLASVSDFNLENEIMSFCTQYKQIAANPLIEPTTASVTSSMQTTASPCGTDSNQMEPSSPQYSSNLTISPSSPTSSQRPSLLISTSTDAVQPQSTKSTESVVSTRTTPSLPSLMEDHLHHSPEQTTSIKSSKKPEKQRKFLSTFSIRRKSKSSGNNHFTNNGVQLPDIPDSFPGKPSSFMDNASIYSIQEETTQQHDSPVSLGTPPPLLRKATSFADSFFAQPATSHHHQQHQSQHQQSTAPGIPVDEEGFSIPPPDRSPWQNNANTSSSITGEDQQDASDVTSMDSASLYGTSRIKLDIKNDSVIQEDAKTSQVALSRVASMLKETNPATMKRPRGRRGNTLSIYQSIPSTTSAHTSTSTASVPSPLSILSPMPENDEETSENNEAALTKDMNVINTGATAAPAVDVSSPPSTETIKSPFAHDLDDMNDDNLDIAQGLSTVTPQSEASVQAEKLASSPFSTTTNAVISVRITEVVHAQLQQGQIQRMMVTGEVSLLCGAQNSNNQPIHFVLKHDGLQLHPLLACITQTQVTDDGVVYRLDPTKMVQGESQGYMACLKYQQDQQQSSGLVAPLLVKPMWKCDGDQARLMIKYSKPKNDVNVLDQVMMLTHVDGGCHGAQSMPTGEWVVDQQKMIWSLGDNIQENEQVILAKFATTSQADPQPIAVRFEMKNQLISNLQVVTTASLPSLDGHLATIQHVEKNTRSGKYIAHV